MRTYFQSSISYFTRHKYCNGTNAKTDWDISNTNTGQVVIASETLAVMLLLWLETWWPVKVIKKDFRNEADVKIQ